MIGREKKIGEPPAVTAPLDAAKGEVQGPKIRRDMSCNPVGTRAQRKKNLLTGSGMAWKVFCPAGGKKPGSGQRPEVFRGLGQKGRRSAGVVEKTGAPSQGSLFSEKKREETVLRGEGGQRRPALPMGGEPVRNRARAEIFSRGRLIQVEGWVRENEGHYTKTGGKNSPLLREEKRG